MSNELVVTNLYYSWVKCYGVQFLLIVSFHIGSCQMSSVPKYVATAKLPQPLPAIGLFSSIQLFQLSASLLQLRFLRLQSFSPSECQDKNPATEGVVVQRRACQCYLSCEVSYHLGMTVFFQTWPNLLELAPGYLALWQTPLWKSNQVLSGVPIAVVVLGLHLH